MENHILTKQDIDKLKEDLKDGKITDAEASQHLVKHLRNMKKDHAKRMKNMDEAFKDFDAGIIDVPILEKVLNDEDFIYEPKKYSTLVKLSLKNIEFLDEFKNNTEGCKGLNDAISRIITERNNLKTQ